MSDPKMEAKVRELWDEGHGQYNFATDAGWPDFRDALMKFGTEAHREGMEEAKARRFPIQKGPSILWSMIAPHEAQALSNHSQDLERLAERHGLGPSEALAVLDDTSWFKSNWRNATDRECQVELERRREDYEGRFNLGMEAAAKVCDGKTYACDAALAIREKAKP